MTSSAKEFTAELMLVDKAKHKAAFITHSEEHLLCLTTFKATQHLTWDGPYDAGSTLWLDPTQVANLRDYLSDWLKGHDRRGTQRDRRRNS